MSRPPISRPKPRPKAKKTRSRQPPSVRKPQLQPEPEIARFATCDRCLQYAEDCTCCKECGGTEGAHARGCDDATTQRAERRVVALGPGTPGARRSAPTLRGLGGPVRTLLVPAVVVVVDDARGEDSTGDVRRTRGKSSRKESER